MKKCIKIILIVSSLILFVFLLILTDKRNDLSLSANVSYAEVCNVIIDPGHGGPDGGTVAADGTVEKGINLAIAKKVRDALSLLGINTVMTRDKDISVHDNGIEGIRQQKISDIRNRLRLTEETKNAVYVSIHQNHFSESRYSGTQVFYSPNNERSQQLALTIQSDIAEKLQPENTRKIKKSGTEIYILYHAKCPAVMVECGFLSNPEETALLKSDEYQNKLAVLIADGIIKFISNGASEVI